MKLKFKWLVLFALAFSISVKAQHNNRFIGSWMGTLKAGALELRLGFNISIDSTHTLNTTLDSPDQAAYGIKTGKTTIDIDKLVVEVPSLMGKYEGTIDASDTLLVGKWSQAGQSFDLSLRKMVKPVVLKRPQEPKPPYPYKSLDVTFTNPKANILLAGTFTIPAGEGPFPGVVLVTGSGAQNRDEELFGHKPFMVIADYLTRHGIAVLRYDDRGVFKSKGSFANATTYDFADDAEAAFTWLESLPSIDKNRSGIAGHSEGGLIAPIVAARNKNVDFVILLAGPGVDGAKIILEQSRLISEASGTGKNEIDEQLELSAKFYAIIKAEPDNSKAEALLSKALEDAMNKSKTLTAEQKEAAIKNEKMTFAQITSPWFRTFLSLDPQIYLKQVSCSLLAINGSKDLQVPCDMNLKAIEKAMKQAGNKHYTIQKLEGLNHLFQHCTKGLPAEYGTIEETFAPEALEAMAKFILLK